MRFSSSYDFSNGLYKLSKLRSARPVFIGSLTTVKSELQIKYSYYFVYFYLGFFLYKVLNYKISIKRKISILILIYLVICYSYQRFF